MTQATITRLEELRAALGEATAWLESARTDLGVAIADNDEARARHLRADIRALEARADELAAAVPVAARRVQEAQEAEERDRRVAAAARHNELREQRIAAAGRVDSALRTLGKAWEEYSKLEEISNRSVRNRPMSARAALSRWAPGLAVVLAVPRVSRPHWRTFAESEADGTPRKEES